MSSGSSDVNSAMEFNVIGTCSTSKARACTMKLPHGIVDLPAFMPVATQGCMKGLLPDQLGDIGYRLCLNNTYHLGLKPGQHVLNTLKGARNFQSWPYNLLTDSGGFQIVSLSKIAKVTEEGVHFQSIHDGSPMFLTPEKSISLQNSIGADIIMQLDDVIETTSPDAARIKEAMYRSIRWLDRCIQAHTKQKSQNLFCIVQGGLDLKLRRECCHEMIKRDLPGIAIGGLSGGEEKDSYCNVVLTCTNLLPTTKPRYVMGVGYPEDLVVSVALGADMFDCVWPTRTARFGNAITKTGIINLRNAMYNNDLSPIEPGCRCVCCLPTKQTKRPISRALLHYLIGKESVAAHLLATHNLHYMFTLMSEMRAAICEDKFPEFVKHFFRVRYSQPDDVFPDWAVKALNHVGIDLTN